MKNAIETGIIISLVTFVVLYNSDRDSTDHPDGTRSGMALHIDHLTGCHYLSKQFGGITPRLNRDGKHMCDALGAINNDR